MKFFLLLFCLFVVVGCTSSEGLKSKENTYSLKKIEVNKDTLSDLFIDSPIYNFGTIKTGTKVRHSFKILNKSKIPLIIKSATTSCGCTVARIPNKPILFNHEDSIIAVFSSTMLPGMQNKVINIISNSIDNNKSVTIIGKTVQ
jgi:hypothetical protein